VRALSLVALAAIAAAFPAHAEEIDGGPDEEPTAGMVYVPAGTFAFGDRSSGDAPPKRVRVDGFWIDVYPHPNRVGARPTAYVSWHEGRALCAERGKRLCTEVEWERACRGPDETHYVYGDEPEPGRCHLRMPVHPASKRVRIGEYDRCCGGFGACEMGSNVSEWTATTLGPDPASPKVLRGGGWGQSVGAGRCGHPGHAHDPVADDFGDDGLRCCADFEPPRE